MGKMTKVSVTYFMASLNKRLKKQSNTSDWKITGYGKQPTETENPKGLTVEGKNIKFDVINDEIEKHIEEMKYEVEW